MNSSDNKSYLVHLLLGTNMGDQEKTMIKARILISIYIGHIGHSSGLYETSPWGELEQPNFLNQAIALSTELAPTELMTRIKKIEKILGKKKITQWGPRTIDIDILLYENKIINEVNLEIPHPRMLSRNFVLIPLSEIAQDVIHPIANKSIKELAGMCRDNGTVTLFKKNSK